MKNKKISLALKIAMSVVSIIMGIAFIIQALRIYNSTTIKPIFTRQNTGEAILQISAIIIIWIIFIIINYIIFRKETLDSKVKMSNEAKCKLLISKLDDNVIKNDDVIKKINKKKLILLLISIIVITISSIMCALYVFNVNNFIYSPGVNVTINIKNMTLHTLPFMIVAFIMGIIYSYIVDKFNNLKFMRLQELLKLGKKEKTIKNNDLIYLIVKVCVVVIAITFIIIGLVKGDQANVLQKAVNICTECVGLG